MKKEIIINLETEKDNELIRAFLIYSLRNFSIKQKDIEIRDLK